MSGPKRTNKNRPKKNEAENSILHFIKGFKIKRGWERGGQETHTLHLGKIPPESVQPEQQKQFFLVFHPLSSEHRII